MTDDQIAVDTRGTVTVTPTDHAEWRRLAEAATPGGRIGWYAQGRFVHDATGRIIVLALAKSGQDDSDAAYVAHSSPDRVLALLEENAELKAERNLDRTILDQYQEELNTAEGAVADLMTLNEQAEARIATLEAAIRAHRAAWRCYGMQSDETDDALWALVPEEPQP